MVRVAPFFDSRCTYNLGYLWKGHYSDHDCAI